MLTKLNGLSSHSRIIEFGLYILFLYCEMETIQYISIFVYSLVHDIDNDVMSLANHSLTFVCRFVCFYICLFLFVLFFFVFMIVT